MRVARGAAKRVAANGPVEGRWPLPPDWSWRRAAEFARIVGGSTPPNAADPNNYDPSGTPWITPADLSGYRQPTIASGRRNLASHVVGRSGILPKHSVLISSRAPVGYCAVAANPLATNQGFRSLVLDENVDPFFVRYYVLYSREYFEENASGTTFKELSGSALSELLFPIPDLVKQRAIVVRIDGLFAEVDEGEAALGRARRDLETWRKSLLKAAVTGELTADWRAANPPRETGADLLARILANRRARWRADPRNAGKRYVEPAGPDTTDLPELPDGWTWASVAQLGHAVTGGTPPTSDPKNYDGRIPFFTPGDLDSGRNLSVTKRTISEDGLATVRPIPAQCVLVTCIGATIGKVGFNAIAGATNQQINTLIPAIAELAEYLFTYFDGPGRHRVIEGVSSTTLPILNKGDFSRIPVPLPPLAEALEIARLVREHSKNADEGGAKVEELVGAAATLRQSILAAAFRGELVS